MRKGKGVGGAGRQLTTRADLVTASVHCVRCVRRGPSGMKDCEGGHGSDAMSRCDCDCDCESGCRLGFVQAHQARENRRGCGCGCDCVAVETDWIDARAVRMPRVAIAVAVAVTVAAAAAVAVAAAVAAAVLERRSPHRSSSRLVRIDRRSQLRCDMGTRRRRRPGVDLVVRETTWVGDCGRPRALMAVGTTTVAVREAAGCLLHLLDDALPGSALGRGLVIALGEGRPAARHQQLEGGRGRPYGRPHDRHVDCSPSGTMVWNAAQCRGVQEECSCVQALLC